jgi:hypothetical protein
MVDRRDFLLGLGAALVAGPASALPTNEGVVFFGCDLAVQDMTVAYIIWREAEQEIMRVTGIKAEEFFAKP